MANRKKVLNPLPQKPSNVKKYFEEKGRDIHDAGVIYWLFGVLDGLNLSYSTLKYFFDMHFTNNPKVNTSDYMHDWMNSAGGAAVTAVETLFIMVWSLVASSYNEAEESICDVCYFSDVPTLKKLKQLALRGNKAYIRVGNKLYFAHISNTQTDCYIKEIPITQAKLNQFDAQFPQKEDMIMPASKEQLIITQSLTGHTHFNSLHQTLAELWPYARDIMKGLKNSSKGWRSVITMMNTLGKHPLNHFNSLLLPGAIILGVLGTLNRLWYRQMVSQRKTMQDFNKALLDQIKLRLKQSSPLTEEEYQAYLQQIRFQGSRVKAAAYFSAFIAGMIDSMYLYIGLLGLAKIALWAWPAFVAMSAFCLVFTIAQTLVRVYEEYGYQRKLEVTAAEIKLLLCQQKNLSLLKQLIQELNELNIQLSRQVNDKNLLSLQKEKVEELAKAINEFRQHREQLKALHAKGGFAAFFDGLKGGLAAYSAISSAFFMAGTFMAMTSALFPPALVISLVAIGMACLLGFTTYTLIKYIQERSAQAQEAQDNTPDQKLDNLLKTLKEMQGEHIHHLEPVTHAQVKTVFEEGLRVDPSPQFFFQEWFEIIRSFFSGIGKGSKSVDYTLNPLQEQSQKDGHYHDSRFMLIITGFSALLYSLVLPLKALAKGIGKNVQKTDENEDIPLEEIPRVSKTLKIKEEDSYPSSQETLSRQNKANHSCRTRPKMYSFFSTSAMKSNKKINSKSQNLELPESSMEVDFPNIQELKNFSPVIEKQNPREIKPLYRFASNMN